MIRHSSPISLRRPLRIAAFAAALVTLVTGSPSPAAAGAPVDFIPKIHVGDERFPLATDTADTICIYGGFGSTEGNFQSGPFPDWQGWISVDLSGVAGDYAQLFPRITDLDPSKENSTPVVGFIDNPNLPGGFSTSPNWSYGAPGGYVVNYTDGISGGTSGIWNEVWSPEIVWDLPGTEDDNANIAGCLLEFLVWRHLPFENGMFYKWSVRSSPDGGSSWTPFRDYNEGYFGAGKGDWLRHRAEVGPLLVPSPTHVQIALGVADVADSLGLPGTDATPSPVFDNVALCKYLVGAPTIIVRTEDLFQDSFPQGGPSSLATQAGRDALDVRIDIARDINPTQAIDPGDSLIAKVSALGQSGISSPSTQIFLHWILDTNPLFETAIRGANTGSFSGTAPSGWDQYTGTVGAAQATTPAGIPVPDLYYFDLPDANFMYPGDELRFYISATNDGGATSTEPEDITGFTSGEAYSEDYTMEASPTYSDTAGTHPRVLLVKDGLDLGEEYEFAFRNQGLVEGVHYDSYTVTAPDACAGNGIGSFGAHGASASLLEGYAGIVYDCGDLEHCLLSDGGGTSGSDDGDDIGVITDWHALSGDRVALFFGDNLASKSPTTFVQDILGVDVVDTDVSSSIEDQTVPLVAPDMPVLPVVEQFVVYGGAPALNTFDQIAPRAGAERTHSFLSARGTSLGIAASVYWDRTDLGGNRDVDLTFPYSLASIWEERADSDPSTSRSNLLAGLLSHFGLVTVAPGEPTGVAEIVPRPIRVTVHPNPANPRSVVSLTLDRETEISVSIYDLRGRRVHTLVDGVLAAGRHQIPWHGEDDAGGTVASGVYFMQARSQDEEVTVKIALVR